MDGTIVAAVITSTASIVVGAFTLLKRKPKKAAITSTVCDVSHSMVAVGEGITQTFSPSVHNHYASPSRQTESTPTMTDIANDLEKDRRPFEVNHAHKVYVGLQVCWPVTVYGVWEDRFAKGCTQCALRR